MGETKTSRHALPRVKARKQVSEDFPESQIRALEKRPQPTLVPAPALERDDVRTPLFEQWFDSLPEDWENEDLS